MAIERRLTELVAGSAAAAHGALAQRPGCHRCGDVRSCTRPDAAIDAIKELQAQLLKTAEEHLDWPMPGYTHLQRAQPVYLSHHLLAYFWMLERDRARSRLSMRQPACSLGSGALAGVNFETDREFVAKELGFDSVSPNSIDAVSNRDFVLDYLSAATCATHLSWLEPGDRAVDIDRGFGFLRANRFVVQRLVADAAEEEPRRRRAVARQGAADRRPSRRSPWRLARPAAHVQQGHAGGTAAELVLARPRVDDRNRRYRPNPARCRVLQAAFDDAIHGRTEAYREWLDVVSPVEVETPLPGRRRHRAPKRPQPGSRPCPTYSYTTPPCATGWRQERDGVCSAGEEGPSRSPARRARDRSDRSRLSQLESQGTRVVRVARARDVRARQRGGLRHDPPTRRGGRGGSRAPGAG